MFAVHLQKSSGRGVKLQCILHASCAELQMLLHKTTYCTANNYTKLQTKLCTHTHIHTHTHTYTHTHTNTHNIRNLSKFHTKLIHRYSYV